MQCDDLKRENAALRARTATLHAAILRSSASLDAVLGEVGKSARALTGARYGFLAAVDEAGATAGFAFPGFTPEEPRELLTWPERPLLPGQPLFGRLVNVLSSRGADGSAAACDARKRHISARFGRSALPIVGISTVRRNVYGTCAPSPAEPLHATRADSPTVAGQPRLVILWGKTPAQLK